MSPKPSSIEFAESFIDRPPWNRRWFSFTMAAMLVGIDYFCVPHGFVPSYFILPPMLVAWNWGVREGIALALSLSVAHFGFLRLWGVPGGTLGAETINTIMRVSVLLILVVVTSRLGKYTRISRARVQMLEDILPICSYCKDIRDERGQWEQIEQYVSRHTEANFSHGICPKCAETHFGTLRLGKPDKSVGDSC